MVFVLAVTVLVYLPGIGGGFMFDDYSNIVANEKLHLKDIGWGSIVEAALSGHAGPTGRPVSLLSFSLDHVHAGLDSSAYKTTNIVIHLLVGIELYIFSLYLFQFICKKRGYNGINANVMSLLIASLWLLHPLQVSTVLYIVQRMTMLSALFVVGGLIFYSIGRTRAIEGRGFGVHMVMAWLVFYPLAILSKENGILFPLYALVLEISVFRFELWNRNATRSFRRYALMSVGMGFVLLVVALLVFPKYLVSGYENRSFDIYQRVLTESRVLWMYIGMILLPATNKMGLYHDDVSISTGLMSPSSTLLSIVGLTALVVMAVKSRKRCPGVSFGILFFLAGHVLESSVLPLEIAFEHRNYLPLFGVLVALGCIAWRVLLMAVSNGSRVAVLLAIMFLVAYGGATLSRSISWGDPLLFVTTEALHHPLSPRAQYGLGKLYADIVQHNPERIHLYPMAVKQLESTAGMSLSFNDGLFRLLPLANRYGNIEEEWVGELEARLSSEVFPANNVNMLNWLVSCSVETECGVPEEVIERLINAALSNSRVKGRSKSELMVLASKFYMARKKDYKNAEYYILKAVDAQPKNPRYRVYAARLFVILGNYKRARGELRMAKRYDLLGREKQSISNLYSVMEKRNL
ncbi:tetratricopeptide repeat protein [Thiolapillus sp.]